MRLYNKFRESHPEEFDYERLIEERRKEYEAWQEQQELEDAEEALLNGIESEYFDIDPKPAA